MPPQPRVDAFSLGTHGGANRNVAVVKYSIVDDAESVDSTIFVADQAYRLFGARHVVGTGGQTGILEITKCTGTQVPADGTTIFIANFSLSSTQQVVTVTPTLVDATVEFADGDRMCVDWTTAAVGINGLTMIFLLLPIGTTGGKKHYLVR